MDGSEQLIFELILKDEKQVIENRQAVGARGTSELK
jgi:hypothetical protein